MIAHGKLRTIRATRIEDFSFLPSSLFLSLSRSSRVWLLRRPSFFASIFDLVVHLPRTRSSLPALLLDVFSASVLSPLEEESKMRRWTKIRGRSTRLRTSWRRLVCSLVEETSRPARCSTPPRSLSQLNPTSSIGQISVSSGDEVTSTITRLERRHRIIPLRSKIEQVNFRSSLSPPLPARSTQQSSILSPLFKKRKKTTASTSALCYSRRHVRSPSSIPISCNQTISTLLKSIHIHTTGRKLPLQGKQGKKIRTTRTKVQRALRLHFAFNGESLKRIEIDHVVR